MPMEKLTAGHPETQSADVIAENIARLKALFPEVVTEGKDGASVNVDMLKQLVGDATVTDCDEKFGLNWHGKRRARQLALTPSTGTLRPCPEESVDWDTTQNLFIEGDNLEVLKLLQKSYAGKVKLIYIDPPYNTGNDFVYKDDFKDSLANYKRLTGQLDEEGNPLTTNREASGRFHTDWLNMMYPRIRLARDLLEENGLFVASIDEIEADNLKSICDSVFGPENFVERVVWKNKYGSGALTRGFANVHEYILVYSRTPLIDISAPLSDEQREAYKLRDEHFDARGGYITQPLATRSKDDRPNLVYPLVHDGKEIWPDKQWIWAEDRLKAAYDAGQVVVNEKDGKFSVRVKQYLRDEQGRERLGKPLSLMNGPFNQEGNKEIEALFGERVFSFPKPSALIQHFVACVVNGDESNSGIVMDLFGGSATTAQAVLAQNEVDGGARRFVVVQLPEPLDLNSAVQKAAIKMCDEQKLPRLLTEVAKERIRRASKAIRDRQPMFAGDLGFRVFKLDSSNVREWVPNREDIAESLEEHVVNLRVDRTEQDILYELLLKRGLDLCVPIETREIAGKAVHSIGAGTLFACLAESITATEGEPLALGIVAWHTDLDPAGDTAVIFRDAAFADDVVKTNVAAILEQNGLKNVRSL
ncbi:MAG: site-specific DNA-methyltransferase [Phycisphaerales bacterium]|nr:site-specific DNA-methyltransferase [Phycisphaerales bacterium]